MLRVSCVLGLCGMLCFACSSEEAKPRLPYTPNETALIGDFDVDNPDGLAYRVVSTPDGDACIQLDDACAKPQMECGDNGAADVLLDDKGAVADVICYPTSGVA